MYRYQNLFKHIPEHLHEALGPEYENSINISTFLKITKFYNLI